jgi:hypothetical protein
MYIQIKKVSENSDSATFTYRSESRSGKFVLLKSTKTIDLVNSDNDEDSLGFSFSASKVLKLLELGELPDETEWVS